MRENGTTSNTAPRSSQISIDHSGQWLPSALMADLVRAPMLAGMNVEMNLPFWVTLGAVLIYFIASVAVAARFFRWN